MVMHTHTNGEKPGLDTPVSSRSLKVLHRIAHLSPKSGAWLKRRLDIFKEPCGLKRPKGYERLDGKRSTELINHVEEQGVRHGV